MFSKPSWIAWLAGFRADLVGGNIDHGWIILLSKSFVDANFTGEKTHCICFLLIRIISKDSSRLTVQVLDTDEFTSVHTGLGRGLLDVRSQHALAKCVEGLDEKSAIGWWLR